MRSRYAAFALGLRPYLQRTLADGHPDRADPALSSAIAAFKGRQRFLGLCILHSTEKSNRGEVLFYARLFERGQDHSFLELSEFTREAPGRAAQGPEAHGPAEGGDWRYASGVLLPVSALPPGTDPSTLPLDRFLSLTRSTVGERV